jgi:tRNA(Ile)-lysidine synthase
MKWRNPSPGDPAIELVHPLLDQPKPLLLEYAAEQGIRYREDASNAVLDFQRNRIRHELLPLLRKKYQPALDRTIARVMDIVGAEAEFAGEAAGKWLERLDSLKSKVQSLKSAGRRPKGEEVRASLRGPAEGQGGRRAGLAFEELPVAVQRRCVQLQLLRQGVAADFELAEQLRVAADRPVNVGLAQAQGKAKAGRAGEARAWSEARRVEHKRDRQGTVGRPAPLCAVRDCSGLVRLQAAKPAEFRTGGAAVDLKGRAGEVEFGGARIWWRIGLRRAIGPPKARVGQECFDADKVGWLVRLRHWQPGDRFHPIGMSCPVRLQDFFTNQKVPRDRRRQLIVAATATGEVFWVEGMRIAERFKLTKRTIRCLQWRWKRL